MHSWLKPRKSNLVGREEVSTFFRSYKGPQRKLLINDVFFKVAQLENFLYIQIAPIISSSIVFVEVEKGTSIVVLNNLGVVTNQILNPFIVPRNLVGQGKLIPEVKREEYAEYLQNSLDIEVFSQTVYDALSAVNKSRYINTAWNLSSTLVYPIIR